MQPEFYQHLEQALSEGPVAIATVIHISGSVPREVGAKMLIWPDGQIEGTIGGGAGEAKVIREAVAILRDGGQSQVTIDLSGAVQRSTEGVCGGLMQVWIQCWSGTQALAIAHHLHQCLRRGKSVTLVTPLSDTAHPYLVEPDTSVDAELPGTSHVRAPEPENSSAENSLKPDPSNPVHSNAVETGIYSFGGSASFVERLTPPPTLLIIGAGHVGVALATAAQFSGFQVVVQDDRPEFLQPNRFPAEARVLKGAIAPALKAFQWPDELYIALVTRGVTTDLEALSTLFQHQHQLEHSLRYVGLIGSLKRIRHVFTQLRQIGVAEHLLQTIHAPIGLDIGALTPEEIAISICAELIQVRRTDESS